MIQRIDTATVDLLGGLVRTNAGQILATGDKNGNIFAAEITRGGEPEDLSGCGVTGYFIRPTGETVVIIGTASGNVAQVELPDTCYTAEGPFSLAIKVSGGNAIGTVRVVDGYVRLTSTDAIIDPGTVIPSLSDLLAQIAVMEQATASANAATQSANTAAAAANASNQTVQTALARGDYNVKSLHILGYYGTLSALQSAVPAPGIGDVYGVGSTAPYTIYSYTANGWKNNGELQGPAGPGVPQGGTQGQYLQKLSGGDYDTGWVAIPEPEYPVTSVNGQTGAVTIPERVPTGGTTGQVLSKSGDADFALQWTDGCYRPMMLTTAEFTKDVAVTIGADLAKYTVFAVWFSVASCWGFGVKEGTHIRFATGFASNTVYGLNATFECTDTTVTLKSSLLASPTYQGETTVSKLLGVC